MKWPDRVPGGLSEDERASLTCGEPSYTTILAGELGEGDRLRFNGWPLRVVAVEHDSAVAVRTAEFDFLLHFAPDEPVDVVGTIQERSTAA